jgi:hypothetical protein
MRLPLADRCKSAKRRTPVSSGNSPRRYTRTELFLVRIWTKDANTRACDEAGAPGIRDGTSDEAGMSDGESDAELTQSDWRGTVQRTIDGDPHQFSSWQGLHDLIVSMLSTNRRR